MSWYRKYFQGIKQTKNDQLLKGKNKWNKGAQEDEAIVLKGVPLAVCKMETNLTSPIYSNSAGG